MPAEFRSFFRWGQGLDEELHAVLTALGYCNTISEENRTDFYLDLGSDFIGAKVRAGKKWECKYKVEDAFGIESYVKKKYGKAAFAIYAAEVRLAMQELIGVSPSESFDELLHGATVALRKSRRMLPGTSPSIGIEVCMIEVTGSSWVSIAIEGDSFEELYAELQLDKYSALFRLLLGVAANSPRGSWVLGGYPRFVRSINEGLTDRDYEYMASNIRQMDKAILGGLAWEVFIGALL